MSGQRRSQPSPRRRPDGRGARLLAALGVVVLAAVLVWPFLQRLRSAEDTHDDLAFSTALPATAAPEPTAPPANVGTRFVRSPGIQTWRHWYVGGSNEHLANLRRQGFVWVKQRFAWSDLEPEPGVFPSGQPQRATQPDLFIDGASNAGLKIMIQLDVSPPWARPEGAESRIAEPVSGAPGPPPSQSEIDDDEGAPEVHGAPPFDPAAWEAFVAAFAERYAGRVHAYEILNEPNLAAAWGAAPQPRAYAQVLGAAYRAIKAADPHALVVSAGLSPTGTDLPSALGDVEYLTALYDAMAQAGAPTDSPSAGYFDALGAHAPGFRAAPEVAPEEAAANPDLGGQRYFTFRRVEDLRAEMVARGDEAKPVVVTELGWTIDPRPGSPYAWTAVGRDERVDFTRRALQYAADEWRDWVGPLVLFTAPDPAWDESHEAYWRSLTDDRGWLLDGLTLAGLGPGAAVPLDPTAEAVALPEPIHDLIAVDDHLWAAGARTVMRLEPRDGTVAVVERLPVAVESLAVQGDALYGALGEQGLVILPGRANQ